MLFRMLLGFDEGGLVDDVELDVHAFVFKVSTAQRRKALQAFIASQGSGIEFLVIQGPVREGFMFQLGDRHSRCCRAISIAAGTGRNAISQRRPG